MRTAEAEALDQLDAAVEAVGPRRIAQPLREEAGAQLRLLALERPDLVMERWDAIVRLLLSGNAMTQMEIAHLVGMLARLTADRRVDEAVPALRALLAGKPSVCAHALMVMREVAAARPWLRPAIVDAVLELDTVANRERLENLRGYAIEALDAAAAAPERSPEVVAFVVRGIDAAGSPRTRTVARETLARWGVEPAAGVRS